MTSCTLSMEEFVLAEDQKGKEEPWTETNEYGEFTYQYNDDVTSLNGEPQDYIAMMNDSVIWFMDNMPEKWIPEVDHYIAANCSKTVPLGLCAKVLSVSREGGMIRVEHVPAEKNEVFKKLKMQLDFEYVVPRFSDLEDDSIAPESRSGSIPTTNRPGYWRNDSVFVDMSLFEPRSRADEVKRDTTTVPFGKAFDGPYGKKVYVQIEYKSIDVMIVHEYEDSEENYQEQWNDQYTERNIKLLVGYGNDLEQATKSLVGWPKNMEEVKGMKEAWKKMKEGLKEAKKIKQKGVIVPIPSTPVCFQLRADVSFGFTIMAFGNGTVKYRSQPHRTGYIYANGTKTEIDKDVKIPGAEPLFGLYDLQLGGSADIWLQGRIGGGLFLGNAAGGVGAVAGLEIKGGLKAQLETETAFSSVIEDNQNFRAGYYGTIGGFAEGLASIGPFTYSLGDLTFLTTEIPAATNYLNLKAIVDDEKTEAKMIVTETEEVKFDDDGYPLTDPETGDYIYETRQDLTINAKLNFKQLEKFFLFPKSTSQDQRPALRIKETADASGMGKIAQLVLDDEILEKGKTYEFSFRPKDYGLRETCSEFRVIPCIYDNSTGTITEYQKNTIYVSSDIPRVNQPKCHQTFGREIDPFDFTYEDKYGAGVFDGKNIEDFTEYGVETVVELKRATRITEWGIKYFVYDTNGWKKIMEKDCPMHFDGVCKSGKYTHNISFLSECRAKNPGSGIGGPIVVVGVYYKYDGKLHYAETSKAVSLLYPYER